MTPRELAQRLSEDSERIARYLFPNGKREGQEWRVGSLEGEVGKSLGICLSGNKSGVWSDFATGESGDLLDLWMRVQGCSISQAMKEAKDFLGIYETKFQGHKTKIYKRPAALKCTIPKPGTPVYQYLTEERKLNPETIKAYQIGDAGNNIVFPFMRDGEPVMIKRLMLERRNGKKDIRPTSAEQEPSLFGWQAIPEDARKVTICEGEIDALSSFQLGFSALSVPFGGGIGAKQQWIENEFDQLERFDTIYLCMDQDEEGRAATEEIADRLGRHRCRIVKLPEKDMNACLQAGYDTFDIAKCFNEARTLDPSELKTASYFNSEIIKEFYPPEGWDTGFLYSLAEG